MKQERISFIIENYMSSESFGVISEMDIPLLANELGVTETTVKKDLKELNCVIYKRKPPKIKDLEVYQPILKGLRLKIERRMPKYVQRKSVRTLIGETLWKKVRNILLTRNNNSCSTCGFTSDELAKLHVHEEWEFDEDSTLIKLTGLSLLCHMCHSMHHTDNTYFRTAKEGKWEEVKEKLDIHFMKVNECNQEILVASKRLASKEQILDKMPNAKTVDSLKEFFDKQKQLQNAKWSYSIFNEMPLREDVISALKKKVSVVE
ncbi:hypothetical protein [Bacillus altitudinis]|uniref:hypothetical protein n=1 Tax=Bacillus altitudinis TaxID=293387 RepID=UPI00210185F0|nr:hypothetical protein [Bacillus altitudinis]UTV31687.1 hypothetical protein NM966_12875 [Bacillus altitudinis]